MVAVSYPASSSHLPKSELWNSFKFLHQVSARFVLTNTLPRQNEGYDTVPCEHLCVLDPHSSSFSCSESIGHMNIATGPYKSFHSMCSVLALLGITRCVGMIRSMIFCVWCTSAAESAGQVSAQCPVLVAEACSLMTCFPSARSYQDSSNPLFFVPK